MGQNFQFKEGYQLNSKKKWKPEPGGGSDAKTPLADVLNNVKEIVAIFSNAQ